MRNYLDLLKYTLKHGRWVDHYRTKARTLQIIGPQLEFNLQDGFPLVTSRRTPYKNAFGEELWFLSGSTDARVLERDGNPVWSLWALSQTDLDTWGKYTDARGNPIDVGSCGPIYGKMLREWPLMDGSSFDQLQYAVDTLRTDPSSRRIVVSAWNPEFLPDENLSPQENVLNGNQALAPCHTLYQFATQTASIMERYRSIYSPALRKQAFKTIAESRMCSSFRRLHLLSGHFKEEWMYSLRDDHFTRYNQSILHSMLDAMGAPRRILHLKMFARSQDLPLGTVFNIASYAMLLTIMAKQVKMIPGRYIHTMTDAHIYEDQIPQVRELVKRRTYPLPKLIVRDGVPDLFSYKLSDFTLQDYKHGSYIKFPITK